MCHLCSAVVLYSTCHPFSTGISCRKRATVSMLHPTALASWIVLAFVGLREVPELVWTKATDRAETGEVLEERLHSVEAEVKESRTDSCWDFQVRCDLTCTLTLLALLIITTLATGWVCVRTCFHRAVVETNIDGGQKKGIDSVARGGRDGTMICVRSRWLGCPTLEKKWIMSDCCCGLRGASRSKVGLVLTGGCGLPMETCKKKT